ncbi:MAG: phosphoribosyl-AMP cyclohydrolase [Polyangiaceae bacterium UTPRO1]|jgi:phosphoribosyl-AMP cyclohydrolase|nr:phosphoribosyl-AMP cyclohydrolase [Myxococcales bacterium]OQY68751.1 MAG: phosphoribosyl-AMP cyclohydrolase [Polyangiaceae bacterium UTPRO1]
MQNVIDFAKGGGLVPVVVQDERSGAVLMLAYMNRESFEHTVATGYATYWSRSRQKLWVKGESSGHRQRVRAIHVDCDGDTVLLRVEQEGGAACHEGYPSCFFRERAGDGWQVVETRVFDPAQVYTK